MLNNKKYWLKGGIIALIIIIATFIILVATLSKFLCEYSDVQNIICNTGSILITFLKTIIIPFTSGVTTFLITILVLVCTFGVGTLLGWIYGKVRK